MKKSNINKLKNLQEEPYSTKKLIEYSKWLTSVVLGTLAFYIAVLLQIKHEGGIPYTHIAFWSLLLIGLASSLGIIFRIIYNSVSWSAKIGKLHESLGLFSIAPPNEEEKEFIKSINECIDEHYQKLSKEKVTHYNNRYIWLFFCNFTQTIIYGVALTLLIIFFIKYLFIWKITT